MRAFALAVTGLALGFAGCSTYGTSVVDVPKTPVVHVGSVSVTLPRSLQIGNTARAVVTVKDDNGAVLTGRAVNWFSSSASVATVNDSGVVAAVTPGDAVVSAVSDGVAGQASLAVIAPPPTPTPVASVQVALNPTALMVGQTAKATATLKDASGNTLTGRTVTWQSSNASVASVNGTGDVSAVAAGTSSITASSEGQSGLAALTVNVPPPIPVASVSVSPASSTLQVGGTVQLSAVTRDANNNVLSGRVITWASANTSIATVTAAGLVSAIAAGSVQVTATSEGKSASSAITVSAPVVPVATVSVTLANSTVTAGATTQASATTYDANNNVLTGRVIAWSSSNTAVATVSSSGLVTSLAAGTAQIKATSETKVGTATLTVNAAPPPPPPPPGGSVEPPGMTVLTERAFDAVTENGWTVAPWSGTVNNCEIVTDANAPKSPTNVGRIKYPAGFASGGEPCGMSVSQLPSVRTMYMSFWFKISPNWDGHPTGANKVLHVNIGGSNHFVVNLWGYGNGMMQMGILLQGIVNDGSGNTAANWFPNLGPTGEIVRGQWYHVEVLAVGNTSGAANGSVDWWLDGVKIGSHSGIQYVSGAGTWGERIAWAPTWGGAGPAVPSEMYQYIDHIYVSGK